MLADDPDLRRDQVLPHNSLRRSNVDVGSHWEGGGV
jgi:hypothetical protein